jgi:hypothetical protein
VVRAEACAADFYAALERATDKLEARLRRAADRRRVHYGRRAPASVAVATALDGLAETSVAIGPEDGAGSGLSAQTSPAEQAGPVAVALRQAEQADDAPWHIARTKEHAAQPMTVDDALFQMELVGHDFYLFLDKDSGRPSVVYRRRKGYDYGVISLAA